MLLIIEVSRFQFLVLTLCYWAWRCSQLEVSEKQKEHVLGTLIVVFLDKVLIELGPIRHIMIGMLMLFVVLFLNKGLFGMKQQFRAWRDKKKGEWRSGRAEKGGEVLPEEATEIEDKDYILSSTF